MSELVVKIALFHTTLPDDRRKPGGVEIAVHRLANALVGLGEDVTVFSLTAAPKDARYVHKHLFPDSPQLYRNPILRFFALPFFLNRQTFSEYDVVHFHGDDWFYWRRDVPTVRTLHGSALEEARTATSLKRRISQYCIYPLEHLSSRLANITAAVGRITARLYQTPNIVNNGVDLDLFVPGRKTDNPSILFVGTWEGRKRGQFLYEVFREKVVPRVPEAELCMVTDVCPASHDQVRHVERPSDKELARLYSQSWVFAYPSTYEGFGIPYIEAMASGTAILCSPNDGASYVLDAGEYGIISPDKEFGDRLSQLLIDDDRRHNMAQRGLDRAAVFSWEQVAADHLVLYQQATDTDLSSAAQ